MKDKNVDCLDQNNLLFVQHGDLFDLNLLYEMQRVQLSRKGHRHNETPRSAMTQISRVWIFVI